MSTKEAHHQAWRKVAIAGVSNPIPTITAEGVLLDHITAAVSGVGEGESFGLCQLGWRAVLTISAVSSWQS